MSHNSNGVPVATHEKGDNGFEEMTPRPHRDVQPPRPRLSTVQLIIAVSAAVGLMAYYWSRLDFSVVNEEVVTVPQTTPSLDACPGYSARVVETTSTGLTAHLHLSGDSCNIYGPDLQTLLLTVAYETGGLPFIPRFHIELMVNLICCVQTRVFMSKSPTVKVLATRFPNPSSLALRARVRPTVLISNSSTPSLLSLFRSFASRLKKCCSTRLGTLSYSSRNSCTSRHPFRSMQISMASESTLSLFDSQPKTQFAPHGQGLRLVCRRGQISIACTQFTSSIAPPALMAFSS